MEYANNKVFGGTVNEGAYILYYTQTYNSNPLIDGVSLDYIEPFVTHFFKTQTFTNSLIPQHYSLTLFISA